MRRRRMRLRRRKIRRRSDLFAEMRLRNPAVKAAGFFVFQQEGRAKPRGRGSVWRVIWTKAKDLWLFRCRSIAPALGGGAWRDPDHHVIRLLILKRPCQRAELLEADLLGAFGGLDAGSDQTVFDVGRLAFERAAQHFAALVEGGRHNT